MGRMRAQGSCCPALPILQNAAFTGHRPGRPGRPVGAAYVRRGSDAVLPPWSLNPVSLSESYSWFRYYRAPFSDRATSRRPASVVLLGSCGDTASAG